MTQYGGVGTKFWFGSLVERDSLRDQDTVVRMEGPVTSICVVCDEPSAANPLK
jgi:hypothetical protein